MIFESKCPSFARQVSLSPLNPFRKHSGSPLSPKTTYVLREQTTSADAKSKVSCSTLQMFSTGPVTDTVEKRIS